MSRTRRRKKGASPFRRVLAARPLADLLALDWSQSNAAIGALLGVKAVQVSQLRAHLRGQGHAIPRAGCGRGTVARALASRPIEGLLALDWAASNAAIGELLGLNAARVSGLRRLLRLQGHEIPPGRLGRPRGSGRAQAMHAAGTGGLPDRAAALGAEGAAAEGTGGGMVVPAPPQDGSPWRCPACGLQEGSAGRLASHVRLAHDNPALVEQARVSWRCPLEECGGGAGRLGSAEGFAEHLNQHEAALRAKRRDGRASHPPPARRLVPATEVQGAPERPIDKYIRAGLGEATDEDVAAALGFPVEGVTALRLMLGPPPPRRKAR